MAAAEGTQAARGEHESRIATVQEVFALQGDDRMRASEKRFLR